MLWLGSLIGWEKPIFELGAQPFLLAELLKVLIATLIVKQFKRINGLNFNTVLFDNMSPKNLKVAVRHAKGKYETEASGGVTLKNIKNLASTKVDRISVGELTHSIQALDLKLEI